ncbi:protein sidekick-2-like [Sycon ciliatum]|uniref:protein sidekick-2-like n=1 Tax=Sycon ciliatum TaxID=27933 RepID=UPI0031F63D9B
MLTPTAISINLSWTAVDPYKLKGGLVAYHIDLFLPKGCIVTSTKTNNTHISVGGLTFGTTYTVSVTAESTGGLSSYESNLQVSTIQDVPPPPSIRYHLSTATTIIVIFETLSGHFTIDQYCCMWNRTTVSGTHLPTAPTITCSNVTSIVLDNLDEDSTYTLIGFAFNTAMDNSSHSTPFNLTTKPAAPSEPPASVNITDVNRTSLTVVWDEVPLFGRNGPITQYLVQYNSQEQRVGSDQLSLRLDGLQPNKYYTISVSAIGYQCEERPPKRGAGDKTIEAVPDAPTITLTSTPTSMKADIVSNSPDWNVMRYCVKAAAKATGDNQVILPSQLPANVPNCTDTDTIEIYNLEEFVLYTVSGWVLNGRGEAGTATIKDHKTLQAVPSQAPAGLTVTDITDTSAKLQWNAIPLLDQNGKILTYQGNITAISPIRGSLSLAVVAPALSGDIRRLKPYTNYEVVIAAETTVGQGRWSNAASFRTKQAAPSIGPTGISSTYVNSTALRLTWKVLQDHELNGVLVRYDVRISGPEDYTRVYNVAPSATTRIIPNLNINTVYGMSVRAVNQAAPGPFSNPVQQRTDEFTPDAVTNVSVEFETNTTSVTAIVSWTPLTESRGIITDYTIFYSELNSTEEAQLNTSMSDLTGYKTATVSGKESNALIHAIVERTPCAFVLVASTRIGLGPASEPVFSQGAALYPGQPRQIETRFLDHSTAELTWKHSLTGGNPSSYRMFAFYEGDYVEEQQQQHRRHRSVELNATLLNISQDVGGEELTGRIGNLPAGKHYAFDVVARVDFSGNVLTSPNTLDFSNMTTMYLQPQSEQGTSHTTGLVLGILASLILLSFIIIFARKYRNKAKSETEGGGWASPGTSFIFMKKQSATAIIDKSAPAEEEETLQTEDKRYGEVRVEGSKKSVPAYIEVTENPSTLPRDRAEPMAKSIPLYLDAFDGPSTQPSGVAEVVEKSEPAYLVLMEGPTNHVQDMGEVKKRIEPAYIDVFGPPSSLLNPVIVTDIWEASEGDGVYDTQAGTEADGATDVTGERSPSYIDVSEITFNNAQDATATEGRGEVAKDEASEEIAESKRNQTADVTKKRAPLYINVPGHQSRRTQAATATEGACETGQDDVIQDNGIEDDPYDNPQVMNMSASHYVNIARIPSRHRQSFTFTQGVHDTAEDDDVYEKTPCDGLGRDLGA